MRQEAGLRPNSGLALSSPPAVRPLPVRRPGVGDAALGGHAELFLPSLGLVAEALRQLYQITDIRGVCFDATAGTQRSCKEALLNL